MSDKGWRLSNFVSDFLHLNASNVAMPTNQRPKHPPYVVFFVSYEFCVVCVYKRVVFFVLYFLCCNCSLNNELTLKMQNLDVTQATPSQLRPKKRNPRQIIAKRWKEKKGRDCLSLTFSFPIFKLKMLLRKLQGKLKSKRVSLDASIFMSQVDPAIKLEERGPFWSGLQDFRRYFTTTLCCIRAWCMCCIRVLYELVVCMLYFFVLYFSKEWN